LFCGFWVLVFLERFAILFLHTSTIYLLTALTAVTSLVFSSIKQCRIIKNYRKVGADMFLAIRRINAKFCSYGYFFVAKQGW
jgi:hypothetical protein